MSIKSGRRIPLHGGGHSVRAFIHARDASYCVLRIMENGNPGEIFHISTKEFISIRDLVQKICDKMNVSFDSCVDITEDRIGKDAAYTLDSTKAQTQLGWKPTISLDQGIDEVIPVDVYVPGCPPRPEQLLDAIIKLQESLQGIKEKKSA